MLNDYNEVAVDYVLDGYGPAVLTLTGKFLARKGDYGRDSLDGSEPHITRKQEQSKNTLQRALENLTLLGGSSYEFEAHPYAFLVLIFWLQKIP